MLSTGEYMLNIVVRFIYTKYSEILYVEPWEDLFTQNTVKYFLLNTWKINLHKILRKLYVEHCGKICLHIILGNTLC